MSQTVDAIAVSERYDGTLLRLTLAAHAYPINTSTFTLKVTISVMDSAADTFKASPLVTFTPYATIAELLAASFDITATELFGEQKLRVGVYRIAVSILDGATEVLTGTTDYLILSILPQQVAKAVLGIMRLPEYSRDLDLIQRMASSMAGLDSAATVRRYEDLLIHKKALQAQLVVADAYILEKTRQ